VLTEQEKKRMRGDRFGTSSSNAVSSNAVATTESAPENKSFKLDTSNEKNTKMMKRLGLPLRDTATDKQKLASRAQRFNTSMPIAKPNKTWSLEEEEKKKKRGERFSTDSSKRQKVNA